MSGRNFSRLCLRFFPDVSVDNLLKCLQGRVMPLLWRRASFSPLLLIRTAFICLITAIPLSAFTKKRPKPNKLGTNCCNLLSSTSWKDQAFFLRIKLPETKLTDLFFFLRHIILNYINHLFSYCRSVKAYNFAIFYLYSHKGNTYQCYYVSHSFTLYDILAQIER